MRIVVVGATGTFGRAIVAELESRHEIVGVGHRHGDVRVDISKTESIRAMYHDIGAFDALVSATGSVHFGPLTSFNDEQFEIGLRSKLMGQVNLVMQGLRHINEKGSFTLTTGILSEEPIEFGVSATMVNRAVEGFVTAAALEMPRGLRINAVSPTVFKESMDAYGPYFRGFDPIPVAMAARSVSKSVEGLITGKVIKVKGMV